MDFYTGRNTVILALVQQGVVTLGVLAAGVVCKWKRTFELQTNEWVEPFSVYGPFLLIPPLIWVTYAYHTLRREDATNRARVTAVASGVVLLLGNLYVVWYAAGRYFYYSGCGGLAA